MCRLAVNEGVVLGEGEGRGFVLVRRDWGLWVKWLGRGPGGGSQQGLEGVVGEELVSGRAPDWFPSGVLSACLWAIAAAECLHLVEPHWQLKNLPLISQKWSP